MIKFLKNIFLILVPFYFNCLLLNYFLGATPSFFIDPMLLIKELSMFLYYSFSISSITIISGLTIIILLLPSYLILFLSLKLKKRKVK